MNPLVVQLVTLLAQLPNCLSMSLLVAQFLLLFLTQQLVHLPFILLMWQEVVTSDALGFGSKKEKKNDEEKAAADDIVYKYKVNETGEHGVVLIINNVYFKEKDKADRKSSAEDAKRLKELFEGLRYQVIVHEDLPAEEIRTKVSAIAAGLVTKKHDSFICCILSHGNPAGVEGVDGKTVTVAELAKSINSTKCPALHGKPKVFFFQACRGTEVPEPSTADSSGQWLPNKEEEMVADGTARALPPEADFLFGFSTSDGNVAARGVYSGSQYIKALCEFLDPKYSSRLSLDELLLLVNYKVSGNPIDYKMSYKYHQMPEIRSTLRGKFYFKK
uniref:Caspase family p20 domain-containing protein n=1 Tax=Amphimedon queenslandica TaxID=400682 RepID=A0A1X7SKL3_AMPQE